MADAPLMNRLKEMILSGELAPGERVTEARLAEDLCISRTPIRNILPRLAAEGFLEPVGRRGFRVRSFSGSESLEGLEIRAAMEGMAARFLAQRGASPEVLAELDQCLAEGDRLFEKRHLDRDDEARYGEINERFHGIIIEACGSRLLHAFVERLNLVPFVAPSVIVFDQIGLREAFDMLFLAHGTHHAIVDAIRAGDGHRAEMLFREHAHHQRLSMFSRSAGLRSTANEAAQAASGRKAKPAKRKAGPASASSGTP